MLQRVDRLPNLRITPGWDLINHYVQKRKAKQLSHTQPRVKRWRCVYDLYKRFVVCESVCAPTLNLTMGETENYEKTGNLISGVDRSPGVIATINGNQYVNKFKPYWWFFTSGFQLGLLVKKMQDILIDFRYVWGVSSVLDDYSYIGASGVSGNIRTSSFRVGMPIPFLISEKNLNRQNNLFKFLSQTKTNKPCYIQNLLNPLQRLCW